MPSVPLARNSLATGGKCNGGRFVDEGTQRIGTIVWLSLIFEGGLICFFGIVRFAIGAK